MSINYLRRLPCVSLRFCIALAGMLFLPTTGVADEFIQKDGISSLRINGFLSQGYIKTNKNNFFGKSDGKGSLDFRELGLVASLRPVAKLQLSGQLLWRRAGQSSRRGISIDFGFLDYSIIDVPAGEFGIRLGRTKNPLGFYNDTRDVPFARPSIILPQSIYFERTRNLALASDGAQLYGESRTDWGNLTVQFGTVFPQVNDRDTEVSILGANRPGDLKTKLSYIGRVSYERPDGRFRFAVSGAQVNAGYDPGVNDFLDSGALEFAPLILSAQYNAERWSITSEYALRAFRLRDFGIQAFEQKFTGESGYLQGTYRFAPKWEVMLRYDLLFTDRTDRRGKEFAAATGRPAHTRFAKDLTVGMRWNVTPAIMLATEYHRINGTGWLSSMDNTDISRVGQHWNMFSFQASYRF
ncbi:MAG: hypothetical protein RQ714_00750 [Nitrosomonas sp.]|nr:hypothetical protein [Nitrosomonas sp.]